MYTECLKLLKCPICNQEVEIKEQFTVDQNEIIDAFITCRNKHQFAIRDGVVDFNVQEQAEFNNWSKIYESLSQEKLDNYIKENTAENFQIMQMRSKVALSDLLNQTKPNLILDIATGRASLVSTLVETLNYQPMIICTDLSFKVLQYDRIKLKKINPHLKINFVSCDCTNLPFLNDIFDCSLSYYGLTNMNQFAQKGIQESFRVLKEQKQLLSISIVVDYLSERTIKIMSQFSEHFHFDLKSISDKEHLYQFHKSSFNQVKDILISEGIGEKNTIDAIPIEGEYFAIHLYQCTK